MYRVVDTSVIEWSLEMYGVQSGRYKFVVEGVVIISVMFGVVVIKSGGYMFADGRVATSS